MGMDPLTIGAMGMMAANMGSQIVGQVNAGKAAKRAKSARQQQQEAMKKVAEANARRIQKQNARAMQGEQADFRRNLAGAQVGLAKSGVSAGAGSALELLSSAAGQHLKNMQYMDEDGKRKVQDALDMGIGYGMGSSGRNTQQGPNFFDTANSLLSLGAKAYGRYKGAK